MHVDHKGQVSHGLWHDYNALTLCFARAFAQHDKVILQLGSGGNCLGPAPFWPLFCLFSAAAMPANARTVSHSVPPVTTREWSQRAKDLETECQCSFVCLLPFVSVSKPLHLGRGTVL